MIKVTGDKEVLKRLEKLRAYAPIVAEESTHRVMDAVQEKAQSILDENIGTGRWGGTWSHGKSYNDRSIEESWEQHKGSWTPNGYIAVLSNESDHACVVGSKNFVSIGINKQDYIGSIKKDSTVLSKDGKQHKVLATKSDMTVKDRPDLVIFNTEKSYKKNGTILTKDHLVLSWNDKHEYAYWEEIGNLHVGDYIIRKIKIPWNKNSGVVKKCIYCNKPYKSSNPSRSKYCSQECYHKNIDHNHNEGMHWELSKESCNKRMGKNNPAYIDGRSTKKYGFGWTESLRRKTKERDDYTCRKCGKKEDLVVHHIDHNKHNNTIDNLITLCRSCHTIRHWRERDCELVEIDLNIFKPVKITKLKHVNAKKLFSRMNAKLYDINVENENSFVVNGIVVHNSAVEFGVHHKIYPKNSNLLDLGQGTYKPWVRGQRGYHYLSQAISDTDYMLSIYYRDFRTLIKEMTR